MNAPLKQHLIDPEICIRCYTCEATCPIEAITHDDNNVVVDSEKCNQCMDCIPVCPTGSIDEWRVVVQPYTLEEQFEWMELPEQQEFEHSDSSVETSIEALDDEVAQLLAEAHAGAGGKSVAPASASKPTINLYTQGKPATATVQGNYRLTSPDSDSDVRHIILDLGALPFPVLEGQSVGVLAPGTEQEGADLLPRLYSISSPRDGERPNYNNISLTVKREPQGVCSNYLCDLAPGAEVRLTGPFGSTFLLPNDQQSRLLMICTGTGSAPFRAFTMHRQRSTPTLEGTMVLYFGARTADSLPYFGPLKKVPDSFLTKHLAFSREKDSPRQYVQDALREHAGDVAEYLLDDHCHVYICGLKAMETGVESALSDILQAHNKDWAQHRDNMRSEGRYHVETY
ncbi:MAG: benzoyl-CoA 2,3-epoxidase subunit BoxA [Gammaproteobacteria bacterium]|nr:benzoyl-CoA 2,3-epoxidase subunit BoxA [Gammaproteobacteria bacterium]